MQKFAKTVLVVLCMVGAGAAQTNPCAGVVPDRYTADPSSCTSYFLCLKQVATPKTCPPGTYFNQAASGGSGGCTVGECPPKAQCPKDGIVNVPVPDSCTTYTLCVYGEAVADITCDGALIFDEALQSCVARDPTKDQCIENKCVDGTVIYHDPLVCGLYYICLKGEAIIQTCPEDMHYDITTYLCKETSGTPECVDGTARPLTRSYTLDSTAPISRFSKGSRKLPA